MSSAQRSAQGYAERSGNASGIKNACIDTLGLKRFVNVPETKTAMLQKRGALLFRFDSFSDLSPLFALVVC